jgi:hypothetical protein
MAQASNVIGFCQIGKAENRLLPISAILSISAFADSADFGISAKAENWGVVVTEAGSYLRLTDSRITQLKAQGPSRTCDDSKEEKECKTVKTLTPGAGWEGFCESRRCSRDTYPESYITEYVLINDE